MAIDDYRILTNDTGKYKVQRRHYTLLWWESWRDETETYAIGVSYSMPMDPEPRTRLFDTYQLAVEFIDRCVKKDAPEIWRVVKWSIKHPFRSPLWMPTLARAERPLHPLVSIPPEAPPRPLPPQQEVRKAVDGGHTWVNDKCANCALSFWYRYSPNGTLKQCQSNPENENMITALRIILENKPGAALNAVCEDYPELVQAVAKRVGK